MLHLDTVQVLVAAEHRAFDVADLQIAGRVSHVTDVHILMAELSPDVLLLDPHYLGVDGVALTRSLLEEYPSLIVILLDEPSRLHEALEAGVRGYLSRDCSRDLLVGAVHTAIEGGTVLQADFFRQRRGKSALGLSPRECEVLEWISQGFSNKQISVKMDLAEATVKKYVYTLMGKLGASDRAHAAALGIKRGVIP